MGDAAHRTIDFMRHSFGVASDGWREIVQALVITAMVVVIDERVDPGFEVAG